VAEYYFNPACFYRARGDLRMAGRALGRAMRRDGAVKAAGDARDEIEREMDKLAEKLPDLCKSEVARRQGCRCVVFRLPGIQATYRAVYSGAPAFAERSVGRLGRTKKRWPAVAFAAIFIFPLVASSLAIPSFIAFSFTLSGLLAAWTRRPKEYVVAMRGGVICVKPQEYLPAVAC
jgi:hypothetical protein